MNPHYLLSVADQDGTDVQSLESAHVECEKTGHGIGHRCGIVRRVVYQAGATLVDADGFARMAGEGIEPPPLSRVQSVDLNVAGCGSQG
jgi:hypothetical protein